MFYIILSFAASVGIAACFLWFTCIEWHKLKERKKKRLVLLATSIIVAGTVLGVIASSVVVVEAGNVGIHDLFGDVSTKEYPSGLRFKHPFATMVQFSIKTHEVKERSEVPSKEGLLVVLDVSILFRIQPHKADELYTKLGMEYYNVVITPQLRSIIREVTSRFEAKALYTSARQNITNEIFDELSPLLIERGVILEKVLLRDLGLPDTLTAAIEMKLTAEQEIEQKQFEVQKEEAEADRKRVEASGIADANEIISESLTTNYLRWYWIEKLDTHDSVIYVPVGNDGMPYFKQIE